MQQKLARLIQRHNIAAIWTQYNPILLLGEIGFETDTHRFKVGDGETPWEQLDYYTTAENPRPKFYTAGAGLYLDTKTNLLSSLLRFEVIKVEDEIYFRGISKYRLYTDVKIKIQKNNILGSSKFYFDSALNLNTEKDSLSVSNNTVSFSTHAGFYSKWINIFIKSKITFSVQNSLSIIEKTERVKTSLQFNIFTKFSTKAEEQKVKDKLTFNGDIIATFDAEKILYQSAEIQYSADGRLSVLGNKLRQQVGGIFNSITTLVSNNQEKLKQLYKNIYDSSVLIITNKQKYLESLFQTTIVSNVQVGTILQKHLKADFFTEISSSVQLAILKMIYSKITLSSCFYTNAILSLKNLDCPLMIINISTFDNEVELNSSSVLNKAIFSLLEFTTNTRIFIENNYLNQVLNNIYFNFEVVLKRKENYINTKLSFLIFNEAKFSTGKIALLANKEIEFMSNGTLNVLTLILKKSYSQISFFVNSYINFICKDQKILSEIFSLNFKALLQIIKNKLPSAQKQLIFSSNLFFNNINDEIHTFEYNCSLFSRILLKIIEDNRAKSLSSNRLHTEALLTINWLTEGSLRLQNSFEARGSFVVLIYPWQYEDDDLLVVKQTHQHSQQENLLILY